MKLISILPFLAIPASAFVVPENLENGTYGVSFDAHGEAKITKLSVSASSTSTPSELENRGTQMSAKYGKQLASRNSQGATGHTFPNHDDYNACTDGMKDVFGNGLLVQGHKIYFVTHGQAFLALCNYSNGAQGGYPYEVDNFNAAMDSSYGSWTTGWYFFSGPNKTLWRDTTGTPICTNI